MRFKAQTESLGTWTLSTSKHLFGKNKGKSTTTNSYDMYSVYMYIHTIYLHIHYYIICVYNCIYILYEYVNKLILVLDYPFCL